MSIIKQKLNEEDFDLPFIMGNRSTRTVARQVLQHTIFIDRAIGYPEEYRDEMLLLEQAAPEDDVRIIINSPGGRLDSGLMLINGIRGCQATVTAHIHEAGSMATGIALACDNWALGDFSYFMLHNASYGLVGKHHEVESEGKFMNKYVDSFIKSMYSGFLTPAELKKLHGGEDFWIDRDELEDRLLKYADYRQKQDEKAARDMQKQVRELMKGVRKNAQAKGDAKAD